MKALREWMSELNDDMAKDVRSKVPSTLVPSPLVIFNHQYDAISGMILAMADVMEAVERHDGSTYDRVTSLEPVYEAAVKVIKEMTKERRVENEK